MEQVARKTILVVDDEPDVRRYLSRILEDAGFAVVTAADGEEALSVAREHHPDLVSLDLIMPRKSGHRFLYEMKKDKALARVPVLVVTAHARDELGRSTLQDLLDTGVMSGPGTYLEKPVSPVTYVRSIRRALNLEEESETDDRLNLKQELEQSLQGASSDALRRALEAVKNLNR